MWKLFVLIFLSVVNCQDFPLKPKFSWSYIDYNFPNESMRKAYTDSQKYIAINNHPVGISVWKNKLFVTIPKWKPGVVSTLNYVELDDGKDYFTTLSAPLIPYPNWPEDKIYSPDGNRLVSVLHARPDICHRLWVVDLGVEDIFGKRTRLSPPSIIVIDLNTDKIIRNHTIAHKDRAFYANFIVDVNKDNCENAYAYISDPTEVGIVVYSWEKNESWRFEHPFMGPDPKCGNLNITGINVHWRDGVLSLALSPPHADKSKTLYFHAVASNDVFSVSTNVLQNKTNLEIDYYYLFNEVGNRGKYSEALTAHMNAKDGILFFPLLNRHSIACWNIQQPLNSTNFHTIAKDYNSLAFVSDLTLDVKHNQLYALASNFAKFITGKITRDDKYVVYHGNLDYLSTPCYI